MTAKNYFEEKGDEYSQYRPTYPDRLGTLLAQLCQNNEHALEIGCGSGQLSGVLAKNFDVVIATDPSIEQISNAQPYDRVHYQEGSAEKIEMPNNSVDLIVAAQSAHWFDLPNFYEQVKKIGKDQAILALISYGVFSMAGEVGKRFSDFYWQEIHQFWPPERKHIEQGYQSFDFPFAELSLPKLSIERHWTIPQMLGYIETWSAVRIARKSDNSSLLEILKRDISSMNSDSDETYRIEWPIVGRVGKLS